MIFDTLTWMLLLFGGVFLVAGGYVMRGGRGEASDETTAPRSTRAVASGPGDDAARLRSAIERMGYEHEAEQTALEKQLDELRAELEAQRAEVQKKSADLLVEENLTRDMETSLEDTRAALRAAESARKEAEKAREELAARAKETGRPAAPKPLPPGDAAARARLADVERALAQTSAERDASTQKVEALERLVEGVRARSRDLSKELETLKSKA